MWLLPCQAKYVCSVNLDSKIVEYYPIPFNENKSCKGLFHCGVLVGDKIYLTPNKAEYICVVDLRKRAVIAIDSIDSLLNENIKGLYLCNSHIKGISSSGDVVFEVDESGRYRKLTDSDDVNGGYTSCIQKDSECLMIPYTADQLIKICIDGKTKNNKISSGKSFFYRGMNIGGKAVLFPAGGSRAIGVVDWDTLDTRIVEGVFTDCDNWVMAPGGWFEMQQIPADDGWWATSDDGFILEFNQNADVSGVYHAIIEKEELKKQLDYYFEEGRVSLHFDEIVYEKDIVGLKQFINSII